MASTMSVDVGDDKSSRDCSRLIAENEKLREQLLETDKELAKLKRLLCEEGKNINDGVDCPSEGPTTLFAAQKCHLPNDSIMRYSRQIILPEIGVQGQIKLSKASVLIVGTGGLGCPAALYLAAAGIGHIGFVDYDSVDLSNLHRQILHTEENIGRRKVTSAAQQVERLNSKVKCYEHHTALNSENALEIITQFLNKYDIIIDATDNVATRYLLNDACVFVGKPLVSGSALRFEGHLTVYNHEDGPCYRCLYPKPPPAETVTNCSDGGVIGAVTGVIGCLQAIEAMKLALGMDPSYRKRLLMFDALDGGFRIIKLRKKKDDCVICGKQPKITKLIDYEMFCGASATDKTKNLSLLGSSDRISVKDYADIVNKGHSHVLIDVRPEVEFEICSLSQATNIPLSQINRDEALDVIRNQLQKVHNCHSQPQIYLVCRQGNDSQKAVQILREKLKCVKEMYSIQDEILIKDIVGGLKAWTSQIDGNFPTY